MKNLKKLRINCGYTQAQLAQFTRTGSGTVCRWELGTTKPDLYQTLKLCRILGCTPAQLFYDSPDKLPVFDIDGSIVTDEHISAELAALDCCFGLVVPCDISSRIRKGDICYFSFADSACNDTLVIASDCDKSLHINLRKDLSADIQIVAVCRMLQIKV